MAKKGQTKETRRVRVGRYRVPVLDGLTQAYFTGGRHGPGKEVGFYNFWAAGCADGRKMRFVFGRALKHLDAGERFRRIDKEKHTALTKEDRAAYAKHSRFLQNVVYVRPATAVEVGRWLASHGEDAVFLKTLKFR